MAEIGFVKCATNALHVGQVARPAYRAYKWGKGDVSVNLPVAGGACIGVTVPRARSAAAGADDLAEARRQEDGHGEDAADGRSEDRAGRGADHEPLTAEGGRAAHYTRDADAPGRWFDAGRATVHATGGAGRCQEDRQDRGGAALVAEASARRSRHVPDRVAAKQAGHLDAGRQPHEAQG
jgi:hypothetical protein